MNTQSPRNGSGKKHSLDWQIIDSIDQISSVDWNKCVPAESPFLKHEFLAALEQSGCVCSEKGWVPQHIVIRNFEDSDQQVVGVSPMYLKSHSWAEYIFDWDWAAGYSQYGLQYFPKLVSQCPFTPLTASKLLVSASADTKAVEQQLSLAAKALLEEYEISSLHWLFVSNENQTSLQSIGALPRASTIEYTWDSTNYESMEDFLTHLRRKKRKNIKRERRLIAKQGVSIEVIQGSDMNEKHWEIFDRCYEQTIQKYGAQKYLNVEFFRMASDLIPENFVFFLARRQGEPAACSICLQGGSQVFGRYWGALEEITFLHFELCYYSVMEYCINNGIQRYNVGVQGEHKLSRGFYPNLARSSHLIYNRALAFAIENYIEREIQQMRAYQESLVHHLPYGSS